MSKKTKTYFPDPDDSDIVFNVADTSSASLADDEIIEEVVEKQQEDSDEAPEDAMFGAALGAAVAQLGDEKQQEDSDSDDAPEDVSFGAAKEAAVAQLESEKKGRMDIQQKQKQKRLKLEAILKEQKEQKIQRLENLASKRLPDDLLDAISSSPTPKIAKKDEEKKRSRVKQSHIKFDSEHYIPLSIDEAPNRFNVAVLDSKPWKNTLTKPGQCAAQDFRHNILYNSKIKREPTSAIHQARMKLQAAGKDLAHQAL